MEVVGGIASVAGAVGILAIVGQSIDGILKLKRFFHEIQAAPKTVSNFLGDLESLQGTLVAIRGLIEKIPEEWLVDDKEITVDVLASQAEKCRDDIKVWENDAARLNVRSGKALEAFFKKLRVAGDASTFSEFHRKVASHQQGIQISLDVLGRSFDIRSLKQDQASDEKFDKFAETQSSFANQVKRVSQDFSAQLETVSNTLERVEASSQGSNASISSLASQLSHLIDLVSAGSGGPLTVGSIGTQALDVVSPGASEWCCDALSGIESAFSDFNEPSQESEAECLFCGEVFDGENMSWRIRGKHLADMHYIGKCNLLLPYQTWDQFKQHLIEFHQMSTNGLQLVDRHIRPAREARFHRGVESRVQTTSQVEDVPQSEGLYYARRESIIQDFEHTFFSNTALSDDLIVPLLDLCWRFGRELACLQEEFIINGFDFQALSEPATRTLLRFGASSESLIRYESDPYLHYQLTMGVHNDPSSQIFPTVQKDVLGASNISRSPAQYSQALWGMTALDGLRIYLGTASEMTAHEAAGNGLSDSISRLIMSTKINQRDWINSWLYRNLLESCTTILIMGNLTGNNVPYGSGTQSWIQQVVKVWNTDEAAMGADHPDDISDGAIDSRDSLEVPPKPPKETFKCLIRGCHGKRRTWTKLESFLVHLKTSHALVGNAALEVAKQGRSTGARVGKTREKSRGAVEKPASQKIGTIGVCAPDVKPGGPDPIQVWNKNRPVVPTPPKHLTDEELKQQYGIHMTSRIQTDGDG